MNNSKTPKIVIGVGLVALYAVGFTVFALRGKHDNELATEQSAAVAAPMAGDAAMPALGSDQPAAFGASQDAEAAVASAPAEPASSAPATSNAAATRETAPPPVASRPAPRLEEVPIESMPSPRPPVSNDSEESSRINSGSNAVGDIAASQTDTGSDTGDAVPTAEEASSGEGTQDTEVPALESEQQDGQ